MRNRAGVIPRPRVNADENAMSKHLRQPSAIAMPGSRLAGGIGKSGPQRPALGEVTTTAVNRKVRWLLYLHLLYSYSSQDISSVKLNGKEKEVIETGLKRKSSLVGPQRVLVNATSTARARPSATRPQRTSFLPAKRTSRPVSQEPVIPVIIPVEEEVLPEEKEDDMEIEEPEHFDEPEAEVSLLVGEQEVEAMVGLDDSEAEDEEVEDTARVMASSKRQRVWPEVSTDHAARYRREVDAVREAFVDEVDMFDTTMVSEYSEDIFDYMYELEVCRWRFGLFVVLGPNLTFSSYLGIRDAFSGLYVGAERDYLGDAPNAR